MHGAEYGYFDDDAREFVIATPATAIYHKTEYKERATTAVANARQPMRSSQKNILLSGKRT